MNRNISNPILHSRREEDRFPAASRPMSDKSLSFHLRKDEERKKCTAPVDDQQSSSARIHILRHGESLHNVDREYGYPDPPLTATGEMQALRAYLPAMPDLVIISPMTRTIQTAKIAFGDILRHTKVEVWPDLREAHDAICNKGVSRAEMIQKFPGIDFSQCPETWNHLPHSFEHAVSRAERVRRRLKGLADSGSYRNIYVVTHRGFVAFLVQGHRFDTCECRSYRFASGETETAMYKEGHNIDEQGEQDFGSTLLIQVLCENPDE